MPVAGIFVWQGLESGYDFTDELDFDVAALDFIHKDNESASD